MFRRQRSYIWDERGKAYRRYHTTMDKFERILTRVLVFILPAFCFYVFMVLFMW